MAFDLKSLGVLAYANGFTLWHYRSDSNVTTTKNNNFWTGDLKKILNNHDIIIANCTDGFVFARVKKVGHTFVVVYKSMSTSN